MSDPSDGVMWWKEGECPFAILGSKISWLPVFSFLGRGDVILFSFFLHHKKMSYFIYLYCKCHTFIVGTHSFCFLICVHYNGMFISNKGGILLIFQCLSPSSEHHEKGITFAVLRAMCPYKIRKLNKIKPEMKSYDQKNKMSQKLKQINTWFFVNIFFLFIFVSFPYIWWILLPSLIYEVH